MKKTQINSIGACGCDSDIRAFLSNGKTIDLDAYCDSPIPQHRNCSGNLAHDGNKVFCVKCEKILFALDKEQNCEVCGKQFNKEGICNDCGLPSKDAFLRALGQAVVKKEQKQ